jgi:hypothetical protein
VLLERSTLKAYAAALAILIAGAVGFRMLVAQLNIHLMKEPVELRRPLDTIPTRLGRWERVGLDSVFSDTLIEELGTRRYLDRSYAIDGDPKKGIVHVHVAYYTGTIDAVPHIPERCWAVGGLELTRNSEGVEVAIDRSEWRKQGGRDDARYMVASVKDAVTAEIDEITMPRGDIAMTTIEFQDPKRPEVRQVGGYFFLANGATARTSYDVRSLAFNLTDRYAYYCKIQLTKSGTVKGADESLLEPFKADATELLSELIPPLMRCLPDWPTWEKAAGEKAGGDKPMEERAAGTQIPAAQAAAKHASAQIDAGARKSASQPSEEDPFGS